MIKKRRPLSMRSASGIWVHTEGTTFFIEKKKTRKTGGTPTRKSDLSSGLILSPMPGKILKLNASEGQTFKVGETLCVLEARKMEYSLKAPFDGKVLKIF